MFEDFYELVGPRAHYLFAEVAAQQGDAVSMVSCLEEVVQGLLPGLQTVKPDENWKKRAGIAFFNLAKTLDAKGSVCREGAVLSLNNALQYYSFAGAKPKLSGLSAEQIQDYRTNLASAVSLKTLELVE